MIEAREKNYIFLTLFVTGAAIMVLELMGTRVVAPYYGVSLYVWSSLISVTLVALALGYWLGGKVADRSMKVGDEAEVKREQAMRATRLMYRLILAAGIAMMLVPVLATSVLKATEGLGIKSGVLVSSFVLFTVPLLILGMVTPYAIKVLTDKLKVVGTTAGNLFAISTVGSFMGTLFAGFVLIPNVGTRKILYIQAALLIGVWAAWEIMEKKYAASVLALPLVGFCLASVFSTDKLAEAGGFKVVEKAESFYGQLKVIEMAKLRMVSIDGFVQSGINVETGLSPYPYVYYLESAGMLRPEAKNALVIGLGGGSVATRLQRRGLEVDSVEINGKIVDMARRHFGFRSPEEKTFIQDGRTHILNSSKKYDIVILDAYSGDSLPSHLMTREMFEEVKAVLSADGVFALNIIGYREGEDARIPASLYMTLGEVFPNVRAFSTVKDASLGNIVFFSSEGELSLERKLAVQEMDVINMRGIMDMLERELTFARAQGRVITDDYNPLEFWNIDVSEDCRWSNNAYYPAEIRAF